MKRTTATRSIGRGLGRIEVTTTDTLVAFAAKAGMTAADGDGAHSPFTTALLDNLAVPGLDLRIALGRVRDEVMKKTDNKQEPFVYGSLGGSTVALVPKPVTHAPVKPVQRATAANAPARDYAFAERIGTMEAWQSFLNVHKSGFYADLARAARDKIKAAQQRKKASAGSSHEPKIAAIAPANPVVDSRSDIARAIDPGDLARLLKVHLKRVGCDPGSLDGKWTKQSMHALQEFNKRTEANFDVKVASIDALEAIKLQKGRVCPLVCGKGFRTDGGRCVAIACRRGYVRDDAGVCRRSRAAHPVARSSSAQHAPQSGSVVLCDGRGCKKVNRARCHTRHDGALIGVSEVVCN
jgi:hypothetical protein